MDIELIEIRDFLASHHPFDLLPEEVLNTLPEKLDSRYFRSGTVILEVDDPSHHLHILRTGAVETHTPEGALLARLTTGETYGIRAMFRPGSKAANRVTAIEDTLVYLLPSDVFHELHKTCAGFAYHFEMPGADRLRSGLQAGSGASSDLMSSKLGDLLERDAVCVSPNTPLHEAAKLMQRENVSSLLIEEHGKVTGIITDRDMRNRVVANALDYATPVAAVMTANPISLDASSMAFEALVTMSRHRIRHLPITRSGKPAGVITNTFLVRRQTTSAVFLATDIHKRETPEDIAEVLENIPDLLVQLVDQGATAHHIGRIITSLADATTIRLIQLAEQAFGPAPIPYAWLAGGSQGRQEQTAQSDQDNCLLLSDDYDTALHGDYFTKFADYVCDGLDKAGYIYCPGAMMARTDAWRLPLAQWRGKFDKWINQPEPKALMLASVWFDLRCIHGDGALFEQLRTHVVDQARKARLFIGHLVGNSLKHQVPLGFFKNLVLIHDGEHDNTLDMKHSGVVPIVDLGRVYALAAGIQPVNTFDRLAAAGAAKSVSLSGARDLRTAFDFIATLRLRHQAGQIRDGGKPDNFLSPKNLSSLERDHLKDAFSVIKTMQSAASNTFSGGRF